MLLAPEGPSVLVSLVLAVTGKNAHMQGHL